MTNATKAFGYLALLLCFVYDPTIDGLYKSYVNPSAQATCGWAGCTLFTITMKFYFFCLKKTKKQKNKTKQNISYYHVQVKYWVTCVCLSV
uniref:Uncharacterized protein n=1 Tax=Physcomitrium patens TaxID=3218 RepID=A0A2K1L8U3_PHYPA|nr:hypothetical protein PHYPA_000879 [Physcomitrium patens]